MPFEFAFLDWLYQFRNPVMNTISIFFDYAGAHGEIWIAFTLLLLLFRCTRKAGFAMAVALVLYMAAGHFFLKPLFARPRPCDINTSITMLVARPHGHSFPSGHTASGVAAAITSGVGYASNRAGVMRFTRLSVHWADKRTATSSV